MPAVARAATSEDDSKLEMERMTWIADSSNKGTLAKEWMRLVDFVRTGPTELVRLQAANILVRRSTARPVPATTVRQKIWDNMAGVGTLQTDKVKRALGRIVRDRRADERAKHYARTALEEIARLIKIKEVFDRKGAGTSWKLLVTYLRTGPTETVQMAAADALATFKREAVKDALVGVAVDTKVHNMARGKAMRALKGHAELMSDEDVESIMRADEKGWNVANDLLQSVAGRSDLSVEQVKKILARYTLRSFRVPIIIFVETQLTHHKHEKFNREVRPSLEAFLFSAGRKVGGDPPNLRPLIARALDRAKLPGAVELYVECLREDVARQKAGKSFDPLAYIKTLRRLTGQSMGYDCKLKADDPANLEACQGWFAWWEANKKDARYSLPK